MSPSWLFCHISLLGQQGCPFSLINTEPCSLNFSSVYTEIPSKHLHTQISTLPPYILNFKYVSTPWTTSFPPWIFKAFWAAASYMFKYSQCHAAMPHGTNHPHIVPSSCTITGKKDMVLQLMGRTELLETALPPQTESGSSVPAPSDN